MKLSIKIFTLIFLGTSMFSCVSKKKFLASQLELQTQLEAANKELGECGVSLNEYMNKLSACESQLSTNKNSLTLREEQITDLKSQITDLKTQRDKQLTQVGDLTVLSQSANDNINRTLAQLEERDKYIRFLQAAKTKADPINLALAVNLKGALKDGLDDEDVDIKVDKTVVMINLSDKMLYKSGSATITSRANEVLGKIAKIIENRPDLEVMVEGHTDNVPIKNSCTKDNWDLSVKRATSVVRVLQEKYEVNPQRLIAAGRGEHLSLADNSTKEGRSTNRRTRIIIMPKLDQFYDLLNPDNAPETEGDSSED